MSGAQLSLALFAATMLLLGVVMLPGGSQESAAQRATEGPPRQMTLAELIKNGPGDRRHVEISRFQFGEQYAVRQRNKSSSTEVWVPLFAPGEKDKPLAIAKLSGDDEKEIMAAMPNSSLRAMVSDKPEPLEETIGKELREAYPNMKPEDTFLVLDQAAARYRRAGGTIWFVLSGVFFGAALLLILIICLLRPRRRVEIPAPRQALRKAPAYRDSEGQLLPGLPDAAMQEFLARSVATVREAGIPADGTGNFSLTLGDQGLELILDPYWRIYKQSPDDEIFDKILADARSAIEGGKLALDSPMWAELGHCGAPVPHQIRAFAAESAEQSDSEPRRDCFEYQTFPELHESLLHQGTVYIPAAYAAFPHLVDIAESRGLTERTGILVMAGTMCGTDDPEPIPGLVRSAFDAGVERLRKWSLTTVQEEAQRPQPPLSYLLWAFGVLRHPRSVHVRSLGCFDEEPPELEVNECPHCGEYVYVAMGKRGPVTKTTDERGHILEKGAKRIKPDRSSYPDRLAIGKGYLQQSDAPSWPEEETGNVLAALAAECGDQLLATRILDIDADVQCPNCHGVFKLVTALPY